MHALSSVPEALEDPSAFLVRASGPSLGGICSRSDGPEALGYRPLGKKPSGSFATCHATACATPAFRVPQGPGCQLRFPSIRGVLTPLFLVLLLGAFAQNGPMYFTGPFGVSGILVEGNRQTKEQIILRELTFQEGDTLTSDELYERIERSRENLLNLGLFNTADLLPTYLGPNEVFITITVNERWYWWPKPVLHFADPNFNTWWLTKDLSRLNFGVDLYRFNLRGRNETLKATVQLGYSKEFGLTYRIPFVDRQQRWGVQVSGAYGEQDEITIGTVNNKRIFLKTPTENIISNWRVGGKLTLRRSHDIRHSWGISWTDASVRDTVVARNPEYLMNGQDRTEYLSLGYTFTFDQRDSRAFPLSGSYARLILDRNGIGPEQPDVTSLRATVQRSWKRGSRWSFGAGLNGKVSQGSEDHYYLQEGLGYEEYLRGYEYYILDGQHYFLGKANVLFALVKPRSYRVEPIPFEAFRTLYLAVYLNAFTDQGYVWDHKYGSENFLVNHWQQSYGLGLDIVTSYDQVLRMEVAVNGLSETGFYLHFTQPF